MLEIGIPSSATYAQSLSGIEEMLTALPDNTGNEISARRVRDVVFTLYNEIQDGTFSEFLYSNPAEISNPIGSWRKNVRGWGGTFSNVTLKELFDRLFYVDSGPSATLAFSPTIGTQDFKQPDSPEYISGIANARGISTMAAAALANTGFDEVLGEFSLNYRAIKGTYDLVTTSGRIDRTPIPSLPEANPLFLVNIPTNGHASVQSAGPTKIRLNQTNSYSFTFRDTQNGQPPSTSVSVGYGNRSYIGVRNTNTIPTDDEIRDLALTANNSGFSFSGGFASLKGRSITGHGGGNKYLIIATTETLSFEVFNAPAFIYNLSQKTYKNLFGSETQYNIYISIERYASGINYTIK